MYRSGSARIFGLDVRRDAREIHRRLAYVPSEANLWPALTGAETLRFLGNIHGSVDEAYDLGAAILLPKERIQRDVAALLTAAEIAATHECSDDIVVYRIKRMRLWQRYERYAA